MSRSNFKSLIEKNKIVIPLIQRDYAQGRKEEKNKARNFLEAILDGMNSENGLNLDFIYGSSIENNKFTPLDGQQRLTTLFLLYFYLSLKDNIAIDTLSKFTYEVRASSTDFIEDLIKNKHHLSVVNLRESIENSNWFFLSWNNDPTVISILNMLELIEEIFSDANFTDLEKITFDKLLLNKFDLTDELYVKMNSRGKPLSNFENFKSEFEKSVEKRFGENKVEEFNFKSKLDNEWLDIFWEVSKYDPVKADNLYYNFFSNITLFFALKNIDTLDEFDLFKYNYTNQDIDNLSIILNRLKSYNDTQNHHIRYINIFENFLQPYIKGGRKGITYENRAIFYALIKFFLKVGDCETNQSLFTSWMRVNFNLINNIAFDNIELFKNTIETIDILSENIKDIYKHIQTIKVTKPSKQFEEEVSKAKLIIKNPKWEKELLLAEKHWYLDGEIKFLLDFAENNIEKFIEYRDKFITLFDEKKILIKKEDTEENKKQKINYQTLIHRALLSFEEDKDDLGYLKHTLHGKNRYTFCSYDKRLRIKNENWRKVFSSKYFQSLLDYISTDIEKNLRDKINSYNFDCNNFKSYFINPNKDWEVISYIRNYQIEYKSSQEIYFNRGGTATDKWGWYRVAELYSYYIFKKDFENKKFISFEKVWYWDTSDGNPSIVIEGYKNKYAINIYYTNGFSIMFYNYKSNKIQSKHIIDILEKNKFILDDKKYYLKKDKICDTNKLDGALQTLCKIRNRK
jgi:hypothetical protein